MSNGKRKQRQVDEKTGEKSNASSLNANDEEEKKNSNENASKEENKQAEGREKASHLVTVHSDIHVSEEVPMAAALEASLSGVERVNSPPTVLSEAAQKV